MSPYRDFIAANDSGLILRKKETSAAIRFAQFLLLRYNIVTERETAEALLRADAYLSTQPRSRNVEVAQNWHNAASAGGNVLTPQEGIGSSGRIRTGEDPPTSDDSDPLDPGHNAT
jgi:hypothetical protein